MRRFRRRRRGGSGTKGRKAIFVFFLLILLLVLIDSQLRPLIKSLTATYARQISTLAINEAIAEMMEQNEDSSRLVHVESSGDGKINAIETNIVAINRVKAQASTGILEKFGETDIKEVWIPVGTLLNNDFTRGRGPKLLLLVELHGNVNTEIYSCLEDAGINQTIHKIMLKVTTSVYAVIPGYHTTTDVETEFCVAETVIVGEVPDSYVNLAGDYSDSVSDFVN